MRGELVEDYTTCGHSEQTCYEWDTGYVEYGCTLGDSNPDEVPCCHDYCPLNCRYEVEE